MTKVRIKIFKHQWVALIVVIGGTIAACFMTEAMRNLANQLVTPILVPTYGPYQYSRSVGNVGVLTESEALHFAANSFKEAGLSLDRYTLQEDDRARVGDRFMVRNGLDENDGTLLYVSNDDGRRVVVLVWLEGEVVHCKLVLPR